MDGRMSARGGAVLRCVLARRCGGLSLLHHRPRRHHSQGDSPHIAKWTVFCSYGDFAAVSVYTSEEAGTGRDAATFGIIRVCETGQRHARDCTVHDSLKTQNRKMHR